jgi:Tfp pilus assembly protein PilN
MIKINLLAKRKVKRVDKGQQEVMLGFVAILAAAAAVFFFVHSPMQSEIGKLEKTNKRLKKRNRQKSNDVKNYNKVKKTVQNLQARMAAIEVLDSARATPAFLLHELSRILTPNQKPTMDDDMAEVVTKNPNRRLDSRWDPKHVWLENYQEKKGKFRLEGGAQSDADMTHLAKRLQASIYFEDVVPEGGKEQSDKKSGVSYYKFVITGRVVY